jgi:pimeloyl-ACP methyl ester carboxylesterase
MPLPKSLNAIWWLSTLFCSLNAQAALELPVEKSGYSRGLAADADRLTFVQVNGVKLAYRLEGAGIPIIFVHGEGYSHELWTEQVEAFRSQYLFISYDRRGHGQSEDPVTGYSETAHAEDLNALMKHLGIRDAHFVVNSRGGAIIIQFLKLFGEKVRSITFADATIPLAPISEGSAFYSVVPRLKGPPPSLEQALQGREGAKKSSFTKVAQSRPETRAILDRMVDQYSPRVAMNPQRSDMSAAIHIGPWNLRDFPDMAKISQPMLLIVAELGDVFFIDGATEAHKLWPNSRFHLFQDVDHLLMLEAPTEFNRLVLEFIADAEQQIAGREKWSVKSPY